MKPSTVLFVCAHNSGRSQMAEALTNHFARQRGMAVVARSAGTVGGKQLNPVAVQALAELGVSMEGQAPKLLTPGMIEDADRIISMGCGVEADACPSNFYLTEDWGLADPAAQPIEVVRRIRDDVMRRVEQLLDSVHRDLDAGPA